MKVLHVAPLWYPIKPDAPGGIETLLAALVDAQSAQGVITTLLASASSATSARLVPVVDLHLVEAMRQGAAWEYGPYEQHQLRLAISEMPSHDIVHAHVGASGFILSADLIDRPSVLHTVHTPVTPDLAWFVSRFPTLPITAVSEYQAARLRSAGALRCWVVPNGVDVSDVALGPGSGTLGFIGRFEEAKGADIAVDVARALKRPIHLAGPIVDQDYFEYRIAPVLDNTVSYLGVIDRARKALFYGSLGCVLVPSRWEEPFGMVVIEAMATGTPVVGLANGALPEIIEDGVTGFTTSHTDRLAELVEASLRLDRSVIRRRVAERFDIRRVAQRYQHIYRELLEPSDAEGMP
jgi:glycosyltransferase involved in cell wall biosynthesis